MILSICSRQIDEFSFQVFNTVSVQTYTDSGIDLPNNVTAATLYFKKVNDISANEVSVDLITGTENNFVYLFTSGGLTISFEDFGLDKINGYDYFFDWMYEIRIEYTYLGVEYEASCTVGFLKIIKNIVYQQLLKSKWKKELSCSCGCDPYNTTLRKWDFLRMLQISAELCLISEWQYTLLSLYRITGTDHELARG